MRKYSKSFAASHCGIIGGRRAVKAAHNTVNDKGFNFMFNTLLQNLLARAGVLA